MCKKDAKWSHEYAKQSATQMNRKRCKITKRTQKCHEHKQDAKQTQTVTVLLVVILCLFYSWCSGSCLLTHLTSTTALLYFACMCLAQQHTWCEGRTRRLRWDSTLSSTTDKTLLVVITSEVDGSGEGKDRSRRRQRERQRDMISSGASIAPSLPCRSVTI